MQIIFIKKFSHLNKTSFHILLPKLQILIKIFSKTLTFSFLHQMIFSNFKTINHRVHLILMKQRSSEPIVKVSSNNVEQQDQDNSKTDDDENSSICLHNCGIVNQNTLLMVCYLIKLVRIDFNYPKTYYLSFITYYNILYYQFIYILATQLIFNPSIMIICSMSIKMIPIFHQLIFQCVQQQYNIKIQRSGMWGWLCCRNNDNKQQPQRISKKVLLQKPISKKKSSIQMKKQQQKRSSNSKIQTDNTKDKTINEEAIVEVVHKKDTYVGQELNGKPHGNGTMNYINGDYYKGQWVNGQKEGKGEHYYFQLRLVYNGQWKHDMKNGNGHETQANGSYYQGQFKDGVKHGKGTYFDKQLTTKYTQVYQNGNLKQRKQLGNQQPLQIDEFPTLKLDKQRFNSTDLINFEQKNPQIKQLDLDFLLKYYSLRKIINMDFIDIPVNQWSIKQVHLFLEYIGLEFYKSVFYDNKIKGKDLVSLDQAEMKEDLKMKLGDRKVLRSYIDYMVSLNKTKKKQSRKVQENIKQRRGSLSVQKKKQSLLHTITRSIQHQIIEQDDQWNCRSDQSVHNKNKQEQQSSLDKLKNDYETQNWDKYASRDNLNIFNYHSQNQMQGLQDNKDSEKTQKGSDENHEKQVDMSPSLKRKHSEDKQLVINRNSEGEGTSNHNNINGNGYKKQRSSTSSESSQPRNDEEEQLFKIKRKKTSFAAGPSQQIRELYQFLRENQSLDFIIKQKDIEIIQVIGEGGYGKVSRGRYMQCPVAVKDYMKAGRSHKSRQQFMKQVHILSDLKHPNIVLYMGLCITVNRYQLVTQFMQNGSLYDQIHIKKTQFTKQQQFQIIDDIVQGMVYLHNMKNMLHRDLKSSNVLIAEDYKVKLCDFGLSGHKNKNKKQKKNRIGTYQWMAPQVIRNEELDFFSDVYSFGVILWQILTKQIPYSDMSQTQIIGDVGYDKNHRLPAPPKGSDEFIIRIMDKCLNRNPIQRPTFIQIQQLIKQQRNNRPVVRDVWNIL